METGPRKRARSYVWEHFDLITPKKVKCLICAQELAFNNNTSSMLRHLRSRHPQTTPNPAAPAAPAAPGVTGQGRQAELDEALVDMIVQDCQPFSVVEDKGFKALVNKLDPTYVLPTRQALRAMVETKYKETKGKAIAELAKTVAVSLTADMWTSVNMDAFLGVTCHYINEELKLSSVLLGVTKFPQSHTAENLKNAKELLIDEWGLKNKIHCLITDNAANMVACAKLLRLRNVPCFAHSLNLVVKKALEATPQLVDIRTRARKVVTFFRTSTRAKEKLTEVQEQLEKLPHKLLQEVETRWNSTFFMLQRLHEQREPVGAALASLTTDVVPLSCVDYEAVAECLEVLGPLAIATTELSEEKRVSASKVIPIIRMIQHKITEKSSSLIHPCSQLLSQNLLHFLMTRCSVENIRVLAMATVLDPRFKTLAFGNQTNAQEAVSRVTAECAGYMRPEHVTPSTSQSTTEEVHGHSSQEADSDNLWELLDSRVGATQRVQNATAEATVEVQRYLAEPYLSRGEDPLKYWYSRAAVYTNLYKLAKTYLHMPATSVPCERVFSKAGEVVTKKRNRLKPKSAEMILFLNKNL